MKKHFYKLLGALATVAILTSPVKAQLDDNSIAPNWTLTDINGTTWDLYNLLDEGKTVFLDFSAVWCNPCWSYHTGGALEGLYETYGPDGTNEVMVFFIEGDGGSTLDQLNGIGAGTMGDWVEGTGYPIVLTQAGDESYTSVSDYQIAYFPTIYRVCQNRLVSEVGQLSTAALYATVGDCASATVNVDPSIISYNGPVIGCSEADLSITIQNMGFDVLTGCTIKAFDGATELLSFEWTGSLETYEIATVNLGTITLADAENDIDIQITSADDNTLNNVVSTTITYEDNITQVIHLELKTDNYPTETRWELVDESTGDIIAEDGPYTNGEKNEIVFDEDIELPALGCYTFTCYDSYGDGITGAGYYKLYDASGDLISQGTENIGLKKSDALKVTQAVGITENSILEDVIIFPNPANASAEIAINTTTSADLTISIVNLLGEEVATVANGNFAAGTHNFTVNTAAFANGIYFVKINGESLNTSVKITVLH